MMLKEKEENEGDGKMDMTVDKAGVRGEKNSCWQGSRRLKYETLVLWRECLVEGGRGVEEGGYLNMGKKMGRPSSGSCLSMVLDIRNRACKM